MNGNFSGGGVCIGCLHQTTGINCEICKERYYKPTEVSKLSDQVCQECNCSALGSRFEPGYPYLDCAKSNLDGLTEDMKAGDCFCKLNVEGSKCDKCQNGFFNLTAVNPSGCEACECFGKGTFNGEKLCNQDTGQCLCKNFTTGPKCSSCKNEYYNMTNFNPNGCSSCGCNLGGSMSAVCNKTSGFCDCHSNNIKGRQCDKLENSFYYPKLDFMSTTQLVRSNKLIMAWRGSITIPRPRSASQFRFAFQCTGSATVDAIISYEDFLAELIKVENTCKNCYIVSQTPVLVTQNEITVDITFPSITDPRLVQCTRLIAYPNEFYDPVILSNHDEFNIHCDVMSNNISHHVCQQDIFTLTMSYLQVPLPCKCNEVGSLHDICEERYGQCSCKPGVTGQSCDQCQAGYFNLTQNGCTACGCFGLDKKCHSTTGQCNCEQNTRDLKCDTCEPMYWNITVGIGCQHCNCSSTGATYGECDTYSGQCTCRTGVQGRGCDSCSLSFKDFSREGCQPCNCTEEGSLSTICDSVSGQCVCKNKTTGTQCDKCQVGSFFMDLNRIYEDHMDGCLSCYCSGVTKNCTTVTGKTLNKHYSNLTRWTLVSGQTLIDTYISTRSNTTGHAFKMLSAPIISHSRPLHWQLNTGFFVFDSVLAYSGAFTFYLEIQINGDGYKTLSNEMMVTLKVRIFFCDIY